MSPCTHERMVAPFDRDSLRCIEHAATSHPRSKRTIDCLPVIRWKSNMTHAHLRIRRRITRDLHKLEELQMHEGRAGYLVRRAYGSMDRRMHANRSHVPIPRAYHDMQRWPHAFVVEASKALGRLDPTVWILEKLEALTPGSRISQKRRCMISEIAVSYSVGYRDVLV